MNRDRSFRRTALLVALLAFSPAAGLPVPRARAQAGVSVPAEPVKPDEPAARSSLAAPAVQDAGLQERAKGFYAFLRGRQVNIHSLYQNETFRSYFSDGEALENYIAYITSRLGEHKFRKYRIQRTEMEGLKQVGPERASARVKLVGRHRDTLVFWDQAFEIEDDWRRIEGEWYVFPAPF